MSSNILRLLGIFIFIFIIILPIPIPFVQKAVFSQATLMAFYWATEALPIPVTSLFPLVLFPLFRVESAENVAKAYADPIIYLFLGGFILAIALEKWNLHKRIALKILIFFKGNLALGLLGFMISSAFLSLWISNTATTIMMLPIALSVIKLIEEKLPEVPPKYFRSLLLAIAYSSSIGGVGTLIGSPPNLIFASFYSKNFPENPITFFKWFLFGFPFVLILVPLSWLILILYSGGFLKLKINFEELNIFLSNEYKNLGKFSLQEKIISITFIIVCFLWIFRSPIVLGNIKIPGWGEIFSLFCFFHDSMVAIFAGIFLFFFKVKGEPLLNWKEVEKKLPWGILLLFGGGLALADSFIKSGFSDTISNSLKLITYFPNFLLIFFICFLMIFLTELTSNTAITATMVPLIFSIAPPNINPIFFLLPATISASLAFMLPVGTPPNAIVFSTGHLKVSTMLKIGIIHNFIALFILTILANSLLKILV